MVGETKGKTKTLINVKNLNKSFLVDKKEQLVLKNINMSIKKGEFTVIMGSSGSGKSTLLYSLSGLDSISSGSVEINGSDISKLSNKEIGNFRKNNIGFVYQGINLISNLTVFENISVVGYLKGKRGVVDQKVTELLERVGLVEHKNKYPNQLSGGQQQRIAIARSLINSPEIIFADEPTGALNSRSSTQILDILNELNEGGQTIIMVTHDPKAAVRCDNLIFLSDGEVISSKRFEKYKSDESEKREKQVMAYLTELGW